MADRANTRTMFMHTVFGKPAMFDGRQIVSRQQGRWSRKGAPLVASLDAIRDEQCRSVAWREQRGYENQYGKYSYIRVEVGR